MDFKCQNCSGKIIIPDEKVRELAKDRECVSVSCPKCKVKNKINLRQNNQDNQDNENSNLEKSCTEVNNPDESFPKLEDQSFDFLEEGIELALICQADKETRYLVKAILQDMDYRIMESDSTRDAIRQMRLYEYHLIIIDERTGKNELLQEVSKYPMSIRRNIFVVLISESLKTMDYMMAYVKSVNAIVNLNDISSLERVLKMGIAENAAFYRVFKESLIKAGKN